jgi:hypothetical protein
MRFILLQMTFFMRLQQNKAAFYFPISKAYVISARLLPLA